MRDAFIIDSKVVNVWFHCIMLWKVLRAVKIKSWHLTETRTFLTIL